MNDLDPHRLYAFAEAAGFIPSCQGGTISVDTLYRWRRRGILNVEVRRLGGREELFLTGAEILRLRATETEKATVQRLPTATERGRKVEEAMERIRQRTSRK